MDIAKWLNAIGLGPYETVFREHEIDADVLPDPTESDLEKIGVPPRVAQATAAGDRETRLECGASPRPRARAITFADRLPRRRRTAPDQHLRRKRAFATVQLGKRNGLQDDAPRGACPNRNLAKALRSEKPAQCLHSRLEP